MKIRIKGTNVVLNAFNTSVSCQIFRFDTDKNEIAEEYLFVLTQTQHILDYKEWYQGKWSIGIKMPNVEYADMPVMIGE